jgi:hypothetical protein
MPIADDELAALLGLTPGQYAELPEHVRIFARALLES